MSDRKGGKGMVSEAEGTASAKVLWQKREQAVVVGESGNSRDLQRMLIFILR